MLHPPYTRYNRLYTYHLDSKELPDFDDPDLIGTWIEDETAILFFHRPKERLVAELCAASGAAIIYQADLDYTDWEAGREIEAFTVNGFRVAPVWDGERADIVLDPSVIFGSGFHPSTRLCLEGLLKYARSPELTIDTALDLGCGTGLLAIAAAKNSIGSITALDNNRLAVQVARANAQRNRVEAQVTVREADLRTNCPDTRVDLVMANLYKGLMLELFANPAFWQARFYLLSGFISPMEEELLAALPQDRGLRFLERGRNDRWCFWALARPG